MDNSTGQNSPICNQPFYISVHSFEFGKKTHYISEDQEIPNLQGTKLYGCFNSYGHQSVGFRLVVELHREVSATNGSILYSFLLKLY